MTNQIVDNSLTEADITTSTTDLNVHTDIVDKKRKNGQGSEANKKPKVQENRAIYVTNLPRDTNEHEIETQFKKYGIIDQGADGNSRIKMYKDDEGNFNGECLIVYFKKESVDLAIDMMDNYYFRIEDQSQGMIRVKEADFAYKKHKDSDTIKSKLTRKDKKASERNRAELNRKLAEWSDNEEEVAEAFAPKKNKWAKVCVLRYVFTFADLEEDASALIDIKDDMREEAEKFGDVTNVTLFDQEEDGIVAIKFKEFDSAENFMNANQGRMFAGKKLEITLAEAKPRYKKSTADEVDSDEEERNLDKLTRQK